MGNGADQQQQQLISAKPSATAAQVGISPDF